MTRSSLMSSSTVENSDKLVNRLLESVQDCQKRYGGKTELATEFDTCVHCLCNNLEAVFLHGLKAKPDATTATKRVADIVEIVANTLLLSTDSFWPFVRTQLAVHDRQRYDRLKQIWTDTGKGRAWIRSTLNERSLERYFHIILANKCAVRAHYESWALLCDDERNNLLPNMAAGLNSILFAISIDKAEFNSSGTNRSEIVKKEPIIEAPIINNQNTLKLLKKKRKVTTISFDEEEQSVETTKNMDAETRSTSSSCDSQSSSSLQMDANPAMRKLSIETSGRREKYPTMLEGTLQPLESHIGELTPISVENPTDGDIDSSIIEIPTDISALLTAAEARNVAEATRLQEKVALLTKENDSLKEQLKKYMDAVKMLKQDECDTASPDYKFEAKLFERKLVQVAEMHAELMDFNVALQQALCQKENLVELLRKELAEVRGGPLDGFDCATDENQGCVHVWIPSAFLTGTGSKSHHVYQIFLRTGSDEWNIYRRYAQFHALHSDLKKLDVTVATFDFPPKKSINKKDSTLVEERRKRLQTYLRRILNHWPELSQCNSRFQLEQHLAFFKERTDMKKRGIFASRRSDQSTSATDSHYTGL